MSNQSKGLQAQQAWLCLALLSGLVACLGISLLLRASQLVLDPKNLEDLDRAALQLFMPYLGVAVGGLFGTGQLERAEPDRFRFLVAIATVGIWDLLIATYITLVAFQLQAVEDFIRFADGTLPVFSTLVAAILAYYFGAQSGQARGKSEAPAANA